MPRAFRAPGRVNLIGDHTDYNDGLVLPMAIQLDTVVTTTPRDDDRLVIRSSAAPHAVTVDLTQPLRARRDWSDYVVGVAQVLIAEGRRIRGATLSIASTLPQGAGLSSSAALEVASAFALLDGVVPDRVQVARWCQRAEHDFVGARVGIMDQYVACLGRSGYALLIDCRTLHHRPVSIPDDVAIVVSNTMTAHDIASGEYNLRRQQCEDGVRALRAVLPHIRSLRDVSLLDLEQHGDVLSEVVVRRVRHVVSENARVAEAADAFERRDFEAVGRLMRASHASLRADYDVSSSELDRMVEIASAQPDVFGSRMTGGGFGGCTVTLARAAAVETVMASIREEYARRTGLMADVRACVPSEGAGEIQAPGSRPRASPARPQV
jgi:galactokinase